MLTRIFWITQIVFGLIGIRFMVGTKRNAIIFNKFFCMFRFEDLCTLNIRTLSRFIITNSVNVCVFDTFNIVYPAN